MKKISLAEKSPSAETSYGNEKDEVIEPEVVSGVANVNEKIIPDIKEPEVMTSNVTSTINSKGKKSKKKAKSTQSKDSKKQKSSSLSEDGKDDIVEIRKYANRRLYCTTFSEYIVHDDVSSMIREGRTVVVTDAKTGEDITRIVLAQILLDAEGKDNNPLLPLSFLETLISLYGNGVNHFLLPRFLEQSIKTFESSARGFENYLEQMFDSADDISNPFRNVNHVNRQVFEMNKEMVRNSMRMMMGENFAQFDDEHQGEEGSDSKKNKSDRDQEVRHQSKRAGSKGDRGIALSQKIRHRRLLKRNK